jgi:SAM-dependent methyltransferase
MDTVFHHAREKQYACGDRAALDYGCGIGRITHALAPRFRAVYGLDVSEEMIRRGTVLHPLPSVTFRVVTSLSLPFPNDFFDFAYSTLTLQHLPGRTAIAAILREFSRTLAPSGLLVFNIPVFLPWKKRIQPRHRFARLFAALGIPELQFLQRLGVSLAGTQQAPESWIATTAQSAGLRLREVHRETHQTSGIVTGVFWYTKQELRKQPADVRDPARDEKARRRGVENDESHDGGSEESESEGAIFPPIEKPEE